MSLAGLRAWSKRVSADARRGEGILISLHLVCHGVGTTAKVAPLKSGKRTPQGAIARQTRNRGRHTVE